MITQKTMWLFTAMLFYFSEAVLAQSKNSGIPFKGTDLGAILLFLLVTIPLLIYALRTALSITKISRDFVHKSSPIFGKRLFENLNLEQVEVLISTTKNLNKSNINSGLPTSGLIFIMVFAPFLSMAQEVAPAKRETLFTQPGVMITLVLLFIPLLVAFFVLVGKIKNILNNTRNAKIKKEAQAIVASLANKENIIDLALLESRKKALAFQLQNTELAGNIQSLDEKGLLNNIRIEEEIHLFSTKKNPIPRPKIDPKLTQLVLAFLGSAIFWLVLGTSVGEYVGIKFIAPDVDSFSWLSFGRLRPIHTNLVFWGWASLGMLGLGYYVVPMVGNNSLANIKMGWYSLIFINTSHFLGTISLMAGINNGGGEYREYVWPIMALFAIGLVLSMVNYLRTIAQRKTKEIYISNWYITSAVIFLPIIAIVSYLPFWQNGIGETILQGFYMHQAVGLWFMMFCLGLLYYFLPQQFNKPIYSYSLGVLAFWTQILFYTLIGTHHFVFSALPWWLQTTAIVGSVGMLIPVTSGTINFLMTFKGGWNKVSSSYSLPFFLVGVIYYFTGSYQGTAEAFRSTNLLWHFTDFTIAHSHITMYGIITFILFAGIYAIVPRLTGKEPPQLMVGVHFWLALVGLQFYTIPLMIGGTLKGLSWAEGKPFIDSVILMAPYWLWRAIGGSMMWLSHLVLAYNFYKMLYTKESLSVEDEVFAILNSTVKQA
jgi:cytochrome c oxidase cbb3-type subunit 1